MRESKKKWEAENIDKVRASKLAWYYRNKPTVRKNNKLSYERNKAFVDSLKIKCSKCDESDPICLDFHHLDPSEKEGQISRMANSSSREKLLAEIDKCIILCSNCHRKEHRVD